MKFASAIAAVALTLISSAHAQDSKIPMTVGQALQVLGALRSLDGQQVVVKMNGADAAITQPWQFKSGVLRLAIADDIAVLSKLEAATEKARVGIIREITKGGDRVQAGTPEMVEFQRQYDDLNAAPFSGVDALSKIDAKALNLDVNEIPVTTLSALTPILSR